MITRRLVFSFLALALLVYPGCAQMQSMGLSTSATDTLTSLLTSQLGVTSNQAMGGVGSILSLAKERLSAMNFTTLTSLIPGADTFMLDKYIQSIFDASNT